MTQPGGNQPLGQQQGVRSGQMTAVMRAVSVSSGPKVLRIGLVHGGKVVEERVVKQRTHVTIGPSEKNLFVVLGPGLPSSFRLFELIGSDYYLNFTDGMSGKVALQTGPTDLVALKGQTAKRTSQGAYQVRLTEDSRGKVIVGETTFLFQFVTPPPVQPKPQLPASVKAGITDKIDWSMTIIAAFSFLFHFGLIGVFYSDWADKIIDDEAVLGGLVDRLNKLPLPPPPETPQTTETTDTKSTAASQESAKSSSNVAKSGASGANKGAVSKSEGAALLSKLDQMDAATIGALSSTGAATQGVLKEGQVPTGSLDAMAAAASGVGATGPGGLKMSGPGGGPMVPGQGGGGLASIGGGSGAEGTVGSSGKVAAVDGPKASVSGSGNISVGKVSGADRVLAGARGRIRACYQAGLNANPDMEGKVSFTLSIGAGGSVGSANVTPSGTINGTVVSCIQAVLRGLNFDAPEGGAATMAGSFNFVNTNKGKLYALRGSTKSETKDMFFIDYYSCLQSFQRFIDRTEMTV